MSGTRTINPGNAAGAMANPDPTSNTAIITIDGPAGTGKSTVAHRLAQRLGLEFLDTGAMYRAIALMAIESGVDPADGDQLAAMVRDRTMHFDWSIEPPRLYLGDDDVTDRIRTLEVSAIVSTVAANAAVRAVMVEWQQRIGRVHPRLVTEGRDQGSVVFPDAPVRFFLKADERIRAERRVRQLAERGTDAPVDQVLADIRRRDHLDSTRPDGPLVRPEGAVVVSTDDLTIDGVVDALEAIARRALPDAGFA